MIGPLDEYADLGGGTFARLQDTDLIVSQADVGHLRIDRRETLTQAYV
jgi:hypothetical protein